MPIDPSAALGATPAVTQISWQESDVLLYHLALGAGADPTDVRQLAYATESGKEVLPTFAVVAPTLRATAPPAVSYPGVDVDLRTILHASQRVELHRPIPRDGKAEVSTGVAALYDKGSAAIIVVDSEAVGSDGEPLWTSSMRMYSRGEGGFGGDRGPDGPPALPDRAPDHILETTILPQQALLYRLLGDRNPLHSDPAVASAAGFPRPILHGLCTYGAVCQAVVDRVLDGRASAVRSLEARFAGVVFPGETLRTAVWVTPGRILFTTEVASRDGAPALTGGELVLAGSEGDA
ncbi:MaoC/PaaZ C-terminal domain-containing protein [Mumia sp. DW29H23]|uniref:MaoC/PaaZ C-terminal domain-containing protein n=1 Tax=Mumia sp. DW29H23 TaxID=3421241 RepID=UPI003D69C94D